MSKNRQKIPFQKNSQVTFLEQVNERISHAHHVPTQEKPLSGGEGNG